MGCGGIEVIKRLVIFDCDGTLLDTIEDVCDCFNEALIASGLPTRDSKEIAKYIGLPLEKIVEGIIPADIVSEGMISAVSAEYRSAYARSTKPCTRPFPGITRLLRNLERQGIMVAVNSNKPEENLIKIVREHFKGSKMAIAGYIPGRETKPSGDGARYLMNMCGVKAEHTVYVGDTWIDLETARDAGIGCAIVTWGQGTRELYKKAGQARICSSPEELENVIIDSVR